ncbi:7,8-didemethyl-8-hydroxy-5-deazariboflavin synthase CofG [Alkalicoccus chagannorensis]|uniref:7,8-didemethyl-8-hydroxy-5-deazariboflavin synthase CofG n=1 Tax=Alkalicoccus chagannorensis TaxID=427072 RepID=UPI00054CF67F|nr:7,8-didemethyl-8-hydroxy-5-deazariboflavin synthase CofG [Alkalicoccus chagannorensis]
MNKQEATKRLDGTMALEDVMEEAAAWKRHTSGNKVTFSRNIFIPLTNICRDRCTYCTFQRRPGDAGARIIPEEEVLDKARRAAALGCTEVLVSLGDKADVFPEVRTWLQERGFRNMMDYVVYICSRIIEETGLLPHTNAGIIGTFHLDQLKPVNASMGMMLETMSRRLCGPGQVHEHAPDKLPHRRYRYIEEAGKRQIPFTTGVLLGIGETIEERVEALEAIRDLHDTYGHIQEVIVQNYQRKPGMEDGAAGEVSEDELLRTTALAVTMLQGNVHVQVPPNLNEKRMHRLLRAGISDWGGVSPLTVDYINPESPWPGLDTLAKVTAEAGMVLEERLPVYDSHTGGAFLEEPVKSAVEQLQQKKKRELIG